MALRPMHGVCSGGEYGGGGIADNFAGPVAGSVSFVG